ncbi:glycosyltransferase family 2 protein [Bordetella genomosp. 4]|uniref:glycosyltransferase family 2 protein n=1 Tax=Bordetella genomosp. 4 TaxID=463044 RepID=UPI000B9E4C75|nr:glycosyltransferase family A protein [Bordetella genomosp. 4]OZI48370.1 hypothetical protein CAL21_10920 [Bordetella genomosp. 4]
MDKVISTIRDSGLLDSKWYLSEYPDVAALDMDPAVHYVQLGALLYRDPGPNFSTRAYLVENPDVLRAGINPLYHYITWGEDEGREIRDANYKSADKASVDRLQKDIENALHAVKSAAVYANEASRAIELPDWHGARAFLLRPSEILLPFSVEDLEVKLWGGYSTYALPKLEELKHMSSVPVADRVNIGWHLFRWYSVEGNNNKALENLRLSKYYCSRMGRKANTARRKIAVAEAQCLARMGKFVQARKILDSAIEKNLGKNGVLWLARAAVAGEGETIDQSSMADRDAPLKWINELYKASGLALLRKERENEPLSFFNVTAEDVPIKSVAECREKISIIIPAYNAGETIHISISSLLKQTWSNLEIVVVDDCSTDNTAEVVERFASQDSRVKLIRKEVNGGAYPARNLGLTYVTGDFILVHDSDDWSHPQKIEIQMAELKANPDAVAVMSHWVRFDENLRPVGPWRPTGNYFDLNFSSLMVPRHIKERVGGWDEVRISGDAEYRFRIIRLYGPKSVLKVDSHYLLSLSLTREDSLTQTKATHLRSLDFGLRWLYRDAYQYWHTSETFESYPRIDRSKPRPFPAPYMLRSRSTEQVQYDAIFVTDLSCEPYANEVIRYVQPAVASGAHVGLIHWPRYDRYVHLPVCGRIYDLCADQRVNIITHGESAATKLAVFLHPDIAQYKLDQFPEIVAENILIVVRQFPITPLVDIEPDQVLPRIQSHILQLFANPGVWQAGSTATKKLLMDSGGATYVAEDIWLPLIDSQHRDSRARVRQGSKKLPVLGRSFDCIIGATWPKNFRETKRGYCADDDMQVLLMGSEDLVCSQFGRRPNNWTFLKETGPSAETDFLARIDFYLYFPAATYSGDIDESLFVAMSRGIPIVMPKRFRPIFGDSVIYSTADDVKNVVLSIWKSATRYKDMSEKARNFFRAKCLPEKALERMKYSAQRVEH